MNVKRLVQQGKVWFRQPAVVAGLAFIFLAALVVGAWWQLPFPYTHDGENHLARFMNTAAAVRQGQIPPRFAPDIFAGYGYPVLHYNYPLANLLAIPFVWLRFHPAQILAGQALVALSLGAWSFWHLSRRWASPLASLAGSVMLLVSTYVSTSLLWRGSIGEIWAIGLAPLVLWFGLRWLELPRVGRWVLFVVAAAAFGLSHNVLVLLFAPWLATALLFLAWKYHRIIPLVLTGVLSVGLTLWFWLPALLELSLIVLRDDSLATQAAQHLLRWDQLLWSTPRFGFSFPGPLDSFGFGLGFPVVCLLFLGGVSLIQQGTKLAKSQRFWIIWGVSGLVISLFLSAEFSWSVWQALPALSIVQFPWRWLAVTSVFIPGVTVWVIESLRRVKVLQMSIILLILIQMNLVLSLAPADRVNQPASFYRFFPHTTLTRNENRPVTLTMGTLPNWEPRPQLTPQGAEVKVHVWNGSRRNYEIGPGEAVTVTEPTVYFPGWRTQQNGQTVALEPELADGLIAYQLPARTEPVQISTAFVERTTPRWVGEGLSLLSGVVLIGVSTWSLYRQKRQK